MKTENIIEVQFYPQHDAEVQSARKSSIPVSHDFQN
jgi:hypothetical protein